MKNMSSHLNASEREEGYVSVVALKDYEYDIMMNAFLEPCGVCDATRIHTDHNCENKDHEFQPIKNQDAIGKKKEPVVHLVIGSNLDSFLDRLNHVLEAYDLKVLSISPLLDTESVGIAISKDVFDLRDAEQMLDRENDPVAQRCSQCSLLNSECVNPEHCCEELPEGMRPFGTDEFSAFQGAKHLPNGSRPYAGAVVYDRMSRTVILACDDEGDVRMTLFVDDSSYDRKFEANDNGVEYAMHLYVMMRELGKQGMFLTPTAIELLGFDSAS